MTHEQVRISDLKKTLSSRMRLCAVSRKWCCLLVLHLKCCWSVCWQLKRRSLCGARPRPLCGAPSLHVRDVSSSNHEAVSLICPTA